MRMPPCALALAIIAAPLTACHNPSMPATDGAIIGIQRSERSLAKSDTRYPDTLQIYWFGAGCHLIRVGDDSVLTDPFVSNGASLAFPKPDTCIVRKTLGRIGTPDAIIANHGHHDHILDAGEALTLPGWESVTLHGGKTTCNILAGWGDSIGERCIPLPDRVSSFSPATAAAVRITAYPGDHGPHLGCGFVAFDGKVTQKRSSPPASIGDYRCGEVFNYLVEIGNFKVFYMGGIGRPELTPEIPGGVDAVILCAPGTQNVPDFPRIPLERLRPRHVIIGHHNTFLCDAPDTRLSLGAWDISYVDLLSRRVQEFYQNHPGDTRFETISIPAVTVMESQHSARNVILIRKPGA